MANNKTYEELVESAKPKLTTDDCYTPENIYAGIRTDSALLNAINEANEENRQKVKKIKNMTSWNYPPQLLTAAKMNYLANYGIDISFELGDLHRINKLDNQPANKSVYGGGYLLSPMAADRLAEAEAEAEAERRRRRGWNCADGVTIELSDRERKLCGID